MTNAGSKTRRTAFRTLCRCLTGALGQPLAPPDLPASPAEWEKVLRLSSAHLVTPQLRWALQEQGKDLISAIPADVVDYIDAIYTLNLEKTGRVKEQLAQFIQALNCLGIRPLLLKGAAVIVGGLYPTDGERMVTDIDVLIPPSSLPEILEKLASIGYQEMDNTGGLVKIRTAEALSHHHYPPLFNPDWPVTVELHVQPVLLRYGRLLSTEELFLAATPLSWPEADFLLPAPEHMIVHNIIHTFLVDTRDQMRNMSLRQSFRVCPGQSYLRGSYRLGCHQGALRHDRPRDSFATVSGIGESLFQLSLAKRNTVDLNQKARIWPYVVRQNLENNLARWTVNFHVRRAFVCEDSITT
ncbi:MAG: nucleotidyltransferase family protein [Candidatus Accumulibacter sp.]|nr:nucleotidyltransferase family protein [Candidatus Accumulibacter propinquus]